MKFSLLILTSIFLCACGPLDKSDTETIVKDLRLINLTYSHLDGLSGDIFKFDVVTKTNLSNFYQRGKYKYSHLKCNGIQNYSIIGSVAIDEERLESGKYISPGYLKFCEDESMNTCAEKQQVEKILMNDLSCEIIFGGLLKKSKTVAHNIIISKKSIIQSVDNGK